VNNVSETDAGAQSLTTMVGFETRVFSAKDLVWASILLCRRTLARKSLSQQRCESDGDGILYGGSALLQFPKQDGPAARA
jgi:hypothetical protein